MPGPTVTPEATETSKAADHPITGIFPVDEDWKTIETLLLANRYELRVIDYTAGNESRPETKREIDSVTLGTTTYHTAIYFRPVGPAGHHRMFIYKEENEQKSLLYDLHNDLGHLRKSSDDVPYTEDFCRDF